MAFQEGPFMRIRDMVGPYEYFDSTFFGIEIYAVPSQVNEQYGDCNAESDLPSCPFPPYVVFGAARFVCDSGGITRYQFDMPSCTQGDRLDGSNATQTTLEDRPIISGSWIAVDPANRRMPANWYPVGEGICNRSNPAGINGDALAWSMNGYCCNAPFRGVNSPPEGASPSAVASLVGVPIRIEAEGSMYELAEIISADFSGDTAFIFESIWKKIGPAE